MCELERKRSMLHEHKTLVLTHATHARSANLTNEHAHWHTIELDYNRCKAIGFKNKKKTAKQKEKEMVTMMFSKCCMFLWLLSKSMVDKIICSIRATVCQIIRVYECVISVYTRQTTNTNPHTRALSSIFYIYRFKIGEMTLGNQITQKTLALATLGFD